MTPEEMLADSKVKIIYVTPEGEPLGCLRQGWFGLYFVEAA